MWWTIVAVAVLAYLVYLVLEIHVLPGTPLTHYGATPREPGQGTWAVVTGATDGIGKSFALQLAKQGLNIVLVSRTQAKLDEVAREIEASVPGTRTHTYALDFAAADAAAWQGLAARISALDIRVLVNNVGVSHVMPVPFVEMDDAEMERIVAVNIVATQRITKLVAPMLVRHKNGLILNLGSFSGQWATPMMATYAGSKAFLIGWTQALGEEMRRAHVQVQLLNTYFVVSNMSKVRRASLMVPLPDQYVRSVLSRLGRASGALGRPFTLTPWPAHAWLDWAVAHLVPSGLLLRYAHGTFLLLTRHQCRYTPPRPAQSRARSQGRVATW